MSLQTLKQQKGFTIVELLIVIVVIGILAAITIVAFNGIQNRAKSTKAQGVASEVQKKAEAYNADQGRYPLSESEFTGEIASLGANTNIEAAAASINVDNGQTTVAYVTCPASATASTITGARIHWYDYAAGDVTTAGSGGKSITVGSCS